MIPSIKKNKEFIEELAATLSESPSWLRTAIAWAIAALMSLMPPAIKLGMWWAIACGALALLLFIFYMLLRKAARVNATRLKGAAPFSELDGDLFAKLEREAELDELCTHIAQREAPVILLYGPRGVGKTSLVRAGLTQRLERPSRPSLEGIGLLYGNARRNDFEAVILDKHVRFLKEKQQPVPATVKALIGQKAEDRRIIVVDNADIGDPVILRSWVDAALAQSGQISKVLVLVLDEEAFEKNWNFIRWPNAEAVQPIKIERLTRGQAERIARTLAQNAGLTVSRGTLSEVLNDLESELGLQGISPLAMSVALHEIGQKANFNRAIYREVGYSSGLLKGYIYDRLVDASQDQADIVLKTLAKIDDREFGIDDAQAIPLSPTQCLALFERLSTSEFHILHFSHDRTRFKILVDWISTLRALEDVPIQNRVLKKFAAWRASLPIKGWLNRIGEGRLLLTERDLQGVELHAVQFSGDEEIQKYIARSRRYRHIQLGSAVASVVLLGLLSWGLHKAWWDHQAQAILTSAGLPHDFVKHSHNLTHLSLVGTLSELKWLPKNLVSLNASCGSITSLKGIPSRTLKELDLTNASQLKNLDYLPSTVETLKIHGTRVTKLDKLQSLPKLTSLDISGIPLSDMRLIPPSVKVLEVQDPHIITIDNIPPELTTLVLRGTRIPSLKDLPESLESLTALQAQGMTIDQLPPKLKFLETNVYPKGLRVPETLILSETRAAVPEGVKNLGLRKAAVAGLLPSTLTSLKFYDEVSSLPLEKIPKNLTELKIKWPKDASLDLLPKQLTKLDLSESESLSSLKNAPIQNVTELDISSTDIKDLSEVPDSVTTLRFEFCDSERLEKFPPNLEKLYLGGCSKLRSIDNLPKTTLKELVLTGAPIASLPKLPESLLSLDISKTGISSQLPELPSNLDELILDLGQVVSLKGLPESVKKLRFRTLKQP